MNRHIQLISVLGIGMVCILSPFTAHAEDADPRIAELEKQVAELQEQVAAFQKRLAALEPLPALNQGRGDRSEPEPNEGWKDRANWRALEEGMTKEQVEELLGEPKLVRAMPYGHNWFYQSGYTMFNLQGRLTMWSEPI